MLRQKGQVILEFAFVLPLFLALFGGIFYFGLMYKDYLALSEVARSGAHQASLKESSSDFTKVRNDLAGNVTFSSGMFTWQGNSDAYFSIKKEGSETIVSTVKADFDTKNSAFAGMVDGMMSMMTKSDNTKTTKKGITITYKVYWPNGNMDKADDD